MIYLKSLLAGLAALIVTAALIICVFLFAPFAMERLTHPAEGGAGWNFVGPFSIGTVATGAFGAFIVFAAVSWWAYKRASKATSPKS